MLGTPSSTDKAGTSLAYDEPDSPYRGPLFEIGGRAVHEAIAVLFGECGFPAAWRRGLARAHLQAYRALQRLAAEEPGEDGPGRLNDRGTAG
jgi:hypothetical protein